MKILTVSHFFEAHGGGIERVAAQLNREFVRAGHDAWWAASDADPVPAGELTAVLLRCFNPTERLTGIPLPIPSVSAILTLRRAVRACDAVVVHDSLYLTSIIAALFAKLSGKPLLLIQHIAEVAFAHPALRILMRAANLLVTRSMLAAADVLVFISDPVRRKLLGEPARRRFNLIFNGVDASIFRPSTHSDLGAIRSAHGLPVQGVILIFVGRFVDKKGLGVLKTLAGMRPDLHLALVGRGPIRPEDWGLPNVHVLGAQSQQIIADLYRAVDLLVLPSVGEGFPLVVQEAMASGLAVVCGADSAAADPAASRWLHAVAIDLMDQSASASRCAKAIDQALKHPIDTLEMACYAANAYSWHRMAAAIVRHLSNP